MLKDVIMRLKGELNEHGIILSFTGPFSQGIIEEIGDALKIYLENKSNTKGKMYQLFSIFIEETQNVKNYALSLKAQEEREKVLASGVMIIGEKKGTYFVSSGNLIKKDDIEKLRLRLEQIVNSDKKQLSKLYREKLRQETTSETGGAGLGLIEMARKASQKIEYDFIEREENYSFFTLTIYV